jgi:hypothetical protein
MIWKYTFNGFHGRTEIRLRVPAHSEQGDIIDLTKSQVYYLRGKSCGFCNTSCGCGETGGARESNLDSYQLKLPPYGGELRGNYPQD